MLRTHKSIRVFLCFVTVLALMVTSYSAFAEASSSLDDFLLEAGVPLAIIETMPIGQKQIVFEKIGNKSAVFSGYDSKEYRLNNDGELIPEGEKGRIQTYQGLIPPSDLTLSVIGFTLDVSDTTGNTWKEYDVFPSFVWNKLVKVKNDSFAMSMYPGWEAVPGERNFCLHLMNSQGQSAQQVDITPNDSHYSGYAYKIPSNIGALQGSYQGHAYYKLEKKDPNASPRISLKYAHDYSSFFELSYSLEVGGFGSISIVGDVSKIDTMSDNFYVSGL